MSSPLASCPACGGELQFKSRSSVLTICSFCNSMVVRHDLKLEDLGKVTEMPEDLSPIRIGTKGIYNNVAFEVIGRQKIGWENGSWNEWFLVFDDRTNGWLSDAQGFYFMSRQVTHPGNVPELPRLMIGRAATVEGIKYKVEDIRPVTCIGLEGEVSLQSPIGRESISVDLLGLTSLAASIDYAVHPKGSIKEEPPRVFVGAYVEFEDLNFSNLRAFDGW
ncbi:MAG: DUF4178 domain-containing protein [Proteobacteria bacterium]|nr:MAG: DUF4178 domain-containing protein [Pseudomonadota bacterium]